MAVEKNCDICTTGTPGCLADRTIRLQDYLDQMYVGGRALETWGRFEEFLRYETLFFDVIPYKDPTTQEQYLTYKFKDGLSQIAEVYFGAVDCTQASCKIHWREPKICGDETKLAADATAGTNFVIVESLEPLSGIGENATLLITSAESGNPVGPLYIAQNGIDSANNKITLTDNLAIDLAEGSIVRRGPYLRNRGCDAEIHNTVELGGTDEYSAYTRTISISHEINECELNSKYLVDGGIQAIINARFRKGEAEAAREFIYAAFFDRNKIISGSGMNARTETMGLFPALKKAQDECNIKVAFDLADCCRDGANVCEQARIQIQAFLDIVMDKAMQSGMYGNKVTVAMNKIARRGLHMMQQHFQDFGNVGFMDGSSYDVNIDLPRIKYAGVEVEFKYLPILDMFNYSAMLTIPEDKVGVYQQMYAIVNPDNGMKLDKAPLNSTIAGGTPVLRYFQPDRDRLGAQLGECQRIVGDLKFAVIWLGVDKGAYRFIKNFGDCVIDKCELCDLTKAEFLDA